MPLENKLFHNFTPPLGLAKNPSFILKIPFRENPRLGCTTPAPRPYSVCALHMVFSKRLAPHSQPARIPCNRSEPHSRPLASSVASSHPTAGPLLSLAADSHPVAGLFSSLTGDLYPTATPLYSLQLAASIPRSNLRLALGSQSTADIQCL